MKTQEIIANHINVAYLAKPYQKVPLKYVYGFIEDIVDRELKDYSEEELIEWCHNFNKKAKKYGQR